MKMKHLMNELIILNKSNSTLLEVLSLRNLHVLWACKYAICIFPLLTLPGCSEALGIGLSGLVKTVQCLEKFDP